MRKLFISFLITLGFLASPNLWAQGGLRTDSEGNKLGESLTDAGLTNDLNSFISICGGTLSGKSISFSDDVEPANKVRDVYFVGINHYWKGVNSSPNSMSAYTQLNEGVTKIEKVPEEGMLQTGEGDEYGTFYTYEAKNANKFFFIVRRDNRGKGASNNYNLAFQWYDEWSYVVNTDNGYSDLKSCIAKLKDGKPFFAPHNCDTSLETNHYISLNSPEADDPDSIAGYDFTAFLYIPNNAPKSGNATKGDVGTGEYEYVEQATYYIYDNPVKETILFWETTLSTPVSEANANYYIKDSNGEYVQFKTSEYAGKHFYSRNNGNAVATVTVYKRNEITVEAYTNAPYVFFYTVDLSGKRSEKKPVTGYDCPYDAILNWTTAFDKWKKETPLTKYDGMVEHYILERSYDQITWETVEGVNDVEGNNITDGKDKTFTDTGLKDFDATTAKIGYTVYYRLTSVIQKSNGVEMARRTAEDIVIINIPGTSPFSLTLKDKTKSKYVPGSVNESGNYEDGKNIFTNTIISAETEEHDAVSLATNSLLELVRTDSNGEKVVSHYTVTDTSMSLSDLAKQIGTDGVYTESFETAPGDAIDATYQLRLTIPVTDGTNEVVLSNIVNIVGSKVSNTSFSVHRSGTPDAATCATKELFRNEVKFKPANTGIGTGYYIYCNGEKIMTLRDGGNLKFTDQETGKEYAEAEDGTLSVTLFAEHAPIAEGETGEAETGVGFHYAVVHYDALGTYGSAAEASDYSGAKGELVVTFSTTTSTLGSHYDLVFIRPVLSWKHDKNADDVKSPIRYDIYMKMGQAEFEENGETSSGRTGNVKDWEGDNFGKYIKRGSVNYGDGSTFADEIYYARRKQSSGTWVNPIANDEIRPVSYYVKAVYSDDANIEKNVAEKNSDVFAVKASAGGVFTAIDDVAAEGVSVEANDGVITVTGASGTIVVYSATGQAVATAQGDGGVTTIDASNLNGVYIVKAKNMNSTRILIK